MFDKKKFLILVFCYLLWNVIGDYVINGETTIVRSCVDFFSILSFVIWSTKTDVP